MMCFVISVLAASTGLGQDWAQEMFDHTTYNFGTVPRGAKVRHVFTMENIYVEDAHIASVRSSCGCAKPKHSAKILKTWEKAEIVAELDTRGFYGQKDATLTVVLDRPFPAEVRLHVHAYIRRDVVVQPGVIQFGTVDQGTAQLQKATIEYAGRNNWRILSVESANPHLQAQVVEVSRIAGEVTYELQVTLKSSAPVGYLRDRVVLVTDDVNPRAARVPVAVEGVIAAAIAARPSSLPEQVVYAGQTVTRRVIVQGKTPFRIVAVTSSDKRLKCTVSEGGTTLHFVHVTFTAGEAPERVQATIRIETDRAGTVLEIPVRIRVTKRQ